MEENEVLSNEELSRITRQIFGENTDFDDAYALAQKHAEALRESIYDTSLLDKRETTSLHVAVQEISDPEKNEIFLLFYNKDEPWVLLQPNNEGVSALDILCRQGNEWLIRFLLPDSYDFDIDGIADETLDSIDDDDITLYDILNLRFKHHVKQEDDNEENNEFGLQYTLTQEPHICPLSECITNNSLNTFKLLVAANFPLNMRNTGSCANDEFQKLICYAQEIDSRIKTLEIQRDDDLITHLLCYPEEVEALIRLNNHCGLFAALSRKAFNEEYLTQLCIGMAGCIPKFLGCNERGTDFIFAFLAFIGIQTKGHSVKFYHAILKALLIHFETPQINAIIFMINAFVASRQLEWIEEWTEDKAGEFHDAYVWHIKDANDFDPQFFEEIQSPDSSDDSDADPVFIRPHEVKLLIETRRTIKEFCSSLWKEDAQSLLQIAAHKNITAIMRIFLAAGATFSEKMMASGSFSTLCRLTKVLGDQKLKHFIFLIDTLEETALERLCQEIADGGLKEYTDELFDSTRKFQCGEDIITLESLAKQDADYLLNVSVTSRLGDKFLPRLFRLICDNENANAFFYLNYEAGLDSVKNDSTRKLVLHYFFSIFLSKRPDCFFASLIKKQSSEILIKLDVLMQEPPDYSFKNKIYEMLKPGERPYSRRLLCAVATRAVEDGELQEHTARLIQLVFKRSASNALRTIECDEKIYEVIKSDDDIALMGKLIDLLQKRRQVARARVVFWCIDQGFRSIGRVPDREILKMMTFNVLQKEGQNTFPDLSETSRLKRKKK